MLKASQLKMKHNDVLLMYVPENEALNRTIYFKENTHDDEVQFFKVINIADNITDVSIGDVVSVPWTRVTEPFDLEVDGVRKSCGVTSVTELLAVFNV